jgi:hypothetical protein
MVTRFIPASFSNPRSPVFAVAPAKDVVKIRRDAPIEMLGPLGCSLQTGAGAVLNVMQPAAGQSIAVYGVGGVGLAGLIAARIAGCDPIIAVDRLPSRLELARELGATHALESRGAETLAEIRKITGGGTDFALETSAVPAVFRLAVDGLRGLGTCVLVGSARAGTEVSFEMPWLQGGRIVRGVIQGDSRPRDFIPRLVDLFMAGKMPLDRLITRYDFADINRAAADATSGAAIKAGAAIAAVTAAPGFLNGVGVKFSGRGDDVFKRLAADKAVDVSGNITRATLNGSIGPWRAVRRHNHVRQLMERVSGGARRRIAGARIAPPGVERRSADDPISQGAVKCFLAAIGPRARLIKKAPRLIAASRRPSISPVVSGVRAQLSTTMSHSLSIRSSSVHEKTCSTEAGFSRIVRLTASTRQPSAVARHATSRPMWPSPMTPTVWPPISPRTAPPTIGLQDHDPSRNDFAMSNRRWRQASIIMIANSPSAGSWPYALHRVTPLGSEETSIPSVPASGTCSKRNFGAAGNPLRQAPVSSTSASASAAAAWAGSLLSRISVRMSAVMNSMIDPACEAASVPRNSAFIGGSCFSGDRFV